jgi:hypothetical protein
VNVLGLEFSHLLNFIEIYDKAFILSMEILDTLSAKHCRMVRAVEMHNPILMSFAQFTFNSLLCFIIKVHGNKNWISLNNFVENIDIQR